MRRSTMVFAALTLAAGVLSSPGPAAAAPVTAGLTAQSAPAATAATATGTSGPAARAAAPVARQQATAIVDENCETGTIGLGATVACAELSNAEKHYYTLTVTAPGELDYWISTEGESISVDILDAAGAVVCYPHNGILSQCRIEAPGAYTVRAQIRWGTGTGSYAITLDSRANPQRPCTALSDDFFAFGSPGVSGTLAAHRIGACYTFDQPIGTVLRLIAPNAGPGWLRGHIRAADGTDTCPIGDTTTCTPQGTGPYRVLIYEGYGQAADYLLRLQRLNDPTGCPALPLSAFGDPAATHRTGDAGNPAGSCHAFTAPAGRLVVRIHNEQDFYWYVYDATGVSRCEHSLNFGTCVLPAAGDYTLLVTYRDYGGPSTYRAAVISLGTTAGCVPARSTDWNLPAYTGTFTSPVQTDCVPFDARPGDVVFRAAASTNWESVSHRVVDGSGANACDSRFEEGCRLTGVGPYRVVVLPNGNATDYRVQIGKLSNPAGCAPVTPAAYGAAPGGAPAGSRCRAITVPTAGDYRFELLSEDNTATSATVFDAAGNRLCRWETCTLPAAGTYYAIRDASESSTVVDVNVDYAATLVPAAPGAGCVDVTDQGHLTPYRSDFTAIGERDCLRLPTPAGARVAVALAGGLAAPGLELVDATGAFVCESYTLTDHSCVLTGTAPFALITSPRNGHAPHPYALSVVRTDAPAGCAALPATLSLTADRFIGCFSISADQEQMTLITWARTSGSGDARLRGFGPDGRRRCSSYTYTTATVTCGLAPGTNTFLLEADAVTADYMVSHRDPD